MASIRAGPDQAFEIMATNQSYVFFRELGGPFGTRSVPLTPGRSLAVGDALLACGVPVRLAATLSDREPWQRPMVAQDTGNAVGGGAWAERAMKSPVPVSLMAWRDR